MAIAQRKGISLLAVVLMSLGFVLSASVVLAGSIQIKASQLEGKWPFIVSEGLLECQGTGGSGFITFSAKGKIYAVNGWAKANIKKNGWRPLEEIWRDDPSLPGAKMDVGPITSH